MREQKLGKMEKRFINIKKLAEYLDVSVHTVRSWIWQERVKDFIIKAGRLVRFDLPKIEQCIQENGVFPPEDH